MRPVTVFVLLLFAGGLAGGDLCARTMAARCLALPAQDAAITCARGPTPVTAPANERLGPALCTAPGNRHRRSVGRGLLPAPRAPDLRPQIA